MEQRPCRKCGESKPLTTEYFYKHKHMRGGLAHMCKECAKKQQARYSLATPHVVKTAKYRKSDAGKGLSNDLTNEFVQALLELPCDYCGTTEDPRGLDRLDNSLGHLQSNVVPCCALCNITRNVNYTPSEMKLLGAVIASIRSNRTCPSTSLA